MKTFAVVAHKRPDLTESVIALRRDEDQAQLLAHKYMAVMPELIVRCRVQPVDLTVEQIKATCFRRGTEDARSGGLILNALPGVYADEYRRGRNPSHSKPASRILAIHSDRWMIATGTASLTG